MTISLDDTITATYDNLKARLPYNRSNGIDQQPFYSSGLLEYPSTDFWENCSSYSRVSESCILDKGMYGYWLESATVLNDMWCGHSDVFINVEDSDRTWFEVADYVKLAGIRPVIELSKSDF